MTKPFAHGRVYGVNYYFVALLIVCTLYAVIWGGAPERIGASAYAVAVAATHLSLLTHAGQAQDGEFQKVEFGVLTVDVLLFASFTALALRANRFWPIWVSALLGLGVLGHLARWLGPEVIPWAYAAILSIWSYPILAIIALGTWHHQRRLAKYGADNSWSNSSVRWDPKPPAGRTS
ncbi:MAG TPA: hypothetical protein VEA61_04035 [Allosphingosinicella sp.]|nr:hypothetical protein [Allosphingosinicella sp.]